MACNSVIFPQPFLHLPLNPFYHVSCQALHHNDFLFWQKSTHLSSSRPPVCLQAIQCQYFHWSMWQYYWKLKRWLPPVRTIPPFCLRDMISDTTLLESSEWVADSGKNQTSLKDSRLNAFDGINQYASDPSHSKATNTMNSTQQTGFSFP